MPPPGRMRTTVSVLALCLVQFVDVLGVTSATTAIPAMTAGLAAPEWSVGLLATVYAMFFGAFLILGARLGDRYGHRRTLLVGVAMFTVVAVIGSTAQGITQLLVARAVQGLAAAVSVPTALRLLLHVTPEDGARRRAVAAWGASGAAAGALGFLVGGFLTAGWGWRTIYWVNLPIGVLLLAAIATLVPRLPPQDRPARTDLPGALLLVLAVMAVVVGASLSERPELRPAGVLVAVTGLAIFAGFVLQQRRAREPLVPRDAFSSANLRTGTALSFVNTATTSSIGVLITLYLQQQRGVGPLEAGLSLLPFSLGVIVGSFLSGPLLSGSLLSGAPLSGSSGVRLSSRGLGAVGLGLVAVGAFVLTGTAGSTGGILVGVVLAGVGLGAAAVAATTIGTDVRTALSGSAAGILNTGAQLGTAVGVAALVALAASTSGRETGVLLAWGVAGAGAAVTAAVLALGRRSRARGEVDSPAVGS